MHPRGANMQLLHLLALLFLHQLLLASAASLDALRAAASGHSLDAWCVAYNCPAQSYACAVDAECRRCLACLHGCGSGETCSAACLYRCGAERLLTDFLSCTVAEHRCVQLQSPGAAQAGGSDDAADGDCAGAEAAANLPTWGPPASLAEARGRWFAIRGGHPFHDCHSCRSEFLDVEAGLAEGSFLFDGVPVRHSRRVVTAWPENGTVVLGLSKVGQAVTEVWRLSWPQADSDDRPTSKEELMLSYCGSSGVWRYRGRLLLSRLRPGRREEAAERRRTAAFTCSVQHNAECRRLLPAAEAALHGSDEL